MAKKLKQTTSYSKKREFKFKKEILKFPVNEIKKVRPPRLEGKVHKKQIK